MRPDYSASYSHGETVHGKVGYEPRHEFSQKDSAYANRQWKLLSRLGQVVAYPEIRRTRKEKPNPGLGN